MKIIIVVAYSKNYAIGKDNKLLWHLGDDMNFFKEITTPHTVLMGKNTYLSIPEKFRPLKNRNNVVISSNEPIENKENLEWFQSLDEAIFQLKERGEKEIYIIGGASIYDQTLNLATDIYATEVDVTIEGDAFFPIFDKEMFQSELVFEHKKNEKNDYDFRIVHYTRL